jgi:hypothetical protein
MFHQKADQVSWKNLNQLKWVSFSFIFFFKYLSKFGEWKTLCDCNQLPNSVQESESCLKKHHELSDDISQIYSEVNYFYFY